MENEFFLLIIKIERTMKTIKLYLSVCLLVAATTASAQFANSNVVSSPTNSRSTDTVSYTHLDVYKRQEQGAVKHIDPRHE